MLFFFLDQGLEEGGGVHHILLQKSRNAGISCKPERKSVCRSEGELAVAQQVCQEMSESLRRLTRDKQTLDLRTAAELDDLYRTKINLEERLVELIR